MKLYDHLPETIKSCGKEFVFFGAKSKLHPKPETGIKFRTINILSKNLRGKTDLHGKAYQPNQFYYIEKK